jgi:hypothetical protein
LLGQQLGERVALQGHQPYEFEVRALKKGVYILRFVTGGESFARRIVVK